MGYELRGKSASLLTLLLISERPAMLSFVLEFIGFIRERKKLWLVPLFIVSLLLGSLVVLTQGSAVAPFIYTIF